jgi:exodeoxyribonuclease VII large subunit
MAATRSEHPVPSHSPFTVSQLTSLLRATIETSFGGVWLEGEVSNLRAPRSGHLYCTLKDESSQIRAVLFRSSARRVRFALQEGMQIIVRGRVTVYEPRGEYQIVIESLEPKGIGAHQLGYEQLKRRLTAEGLFDEERKKPLPSYPLSIGIVTSPTGAALRDILTVLNRRWPLLHIVITPVQVQGEGASEQIAAALDALNDAGLADVIILGRGGGSLEDLWCFNDEVVVRAIARSKIPIISAVGHEVDITLSDFAADHRAPTPSAAAETVVPVLADVVDRLGELTDRMGQTMLRHCLAERRRIELCKRGLGGIRYRLEGSAQKTDELTDRLAHATLLKLSSWRNHVRDGERALAERNPIQVVKRSLALIPQLMIRLDRQVRGHAAQRRQLLEGVSAQLHNLSPLAILGRGYSVLSKLSDGSVIRSVRDVKSGSELNARLADGRLTCSVVRVLPDASSV